MAKVQRGKWWQMHLQMNQNAAIPSYNPEWASDSVLAIPKSTTATEHQIQNQIWPTEMPPEDVTMD